jgi:hypothetical protein
MNPTKDQSDKPENEGLLELCLLVLITLAKRKFRQHFLVLSIFSGIITIAISFLSFFARLSRHASSHSFRANVRFGPVNFPLMIGSANPRAIPISTPTPSQHAWFPVIDRDCCLAHFAQRESFENISAHSLTVRFVRS